MSSSNNRFLKDFRAQVRSKFMEDTSDMSNSEWIMKNTRLRKKPFSFDGFEFQRAIVDDMSRQLSVIKPSQCGLTEVQIRKNLAFLKRTTAVNTIFSLPTDDMYKRVSQTRVAPIVNGEAVFNMSTDKPVRSMALYQIDGSFGYFTGGKESDATSINADAVFKDEVDLADQEILALFESRLQGSQFRISQSFSTPTFENFGIHGMFSASDQHEYLVRCTKCRNHSIPKFDPAHVHLAGLSSDINNFIEIDPDMAGKINFEKSYIFCEACHEPMDVHNPELRSWVPRYSGRRARGYKVTPFCVPSLTLDYIVDQLLNYKQKDALRRFFNTVLGEPYNDSNARLTDADIATCMMGEAIPPVPNYIPVVLGIDVGLTCHLVAMALFDEKPVVFLWEQVPYEQIISRVNQIRQTYNVVGGLMDRHPYTPTANEIRDNSYGLILPNQYANNTSAADVSFVKDELGEVSHVQSNRTTMIDTVAGSVRKNRVAFAGYGTQQAVIMQHLKDMVRIEDPDMSATWQKVTGNDHYFHALGYAFHSLRVHSAIDYKMGRETRKNFGFDLFTVTTKNDSGLGVKDRIRNTTSMELY